MDEEAGIIRVGTCSSLSGVIEVALMSFVDGFLRSGLRSPLLLSFKTWAFDTSKVTERLNAVGF